MPPRVGSRPKLKGLYKNVSAARLLQEWQEYINNFYKKSGMHDLISSGAQLVSMFNPVIGFGIDAINRGYQATHLPAEFKSNYLYTDTQTDEQYEQGSRNALTELKSEMLSGLIKHGASSLQLHGKGGFKDAWGGIKEGTPFSYTKGGVDVEPTLQPTESWQNRNASFNPGDWELLPGGIERNVVTGEEFHWQGEVPAGEFNWQGGVTSDPAELEHSWMRNEAIARTNRNSLFVEPAIPINTAPKEDDPFPDDLMNMYEMQKRFGFYD